MNAQQSPPVPNIDPGWLLRLKTAFEADHFAELKRFIKKERTNGTVHPAPDRILHAFLVTPFDQVQVVILGQDPYHGPGQAHGLCFSVPQGVAPPPSLQNIFQEISRDLGVPPPRSGDLSGWAAQGVLLLNTVLTVRSGEAGSHQGKGWERFTDAAISALSKEREGLVFLLWGRHAMAKEVLVDTDRHYVLKAPHPSPLSAHRGFIGCGHFSKANDLILARGGRAIRWTG
jgi:uracil-DNA glycosylase